MNSFKDIFRGKRILVTGHTGFKGSWLIKVLSMFGAEIKGFALKPENAFDLYEVIGGNDLCDSVIADIRSAEIFKKELLAFRPDIVFHLAAQPLVRRSYQAPVETFEVNAMGTLNLLEALRMLDKPCVSVLITTDKVYHNIEAEYAYTESDALGGYDPYSASKACAEIIINSYRNSFFNPAEVNAHQKSISSARAGNVIGGGDWAVDRLVPDIARALGRGEKVIVRNPDSVRPWQHVLESINGYLSLAAKQLENPAAFSNAYNFGPYSADVLSVRDVVTQSIESWGSGEFEEKPDKKGPHEAKLLMLDINRALMELSWKPKMNASQAIALTIDWYKSYFNGGSSVKDVTERQIQQFFK